MHAWGRSRIDVKQRAGAQEIRIAIGRGGWMKRLNCGRWVVWGMMAGLAAWLIFLAALIYASYVPDVRALPHQLYTQRGGIQAGGFFVGWWIAIAALALCVIGYMREYKGNHCLICVIPAALYVANPWSVLAFIRLTAG